MNEHPAAPEPGPSNPPTPDAIASSEATIIAGTPEVTPTPEVASTPEAAAPDASAELESTPSAVATATPEVTPMPEAVESVPAATAPRSSMPKWLPLFLAAVIPAVIVGIVVFALSDSNKSGGGSVGGGAGVIDGFFRLGPASDGDVSSFKEKLPPDFPKEFPMMPGSKVIASFAIASSDGTNYFAVVGGNHTPDEIYNYYISALDKDPWQVEVARAATEFVGVRFSRPDNPDISGDVTVHHSDLDNQTVAYVQVEDASKKQASGKKAADAFTLPSSRDLPPGFPNDIPIYKGKAASVVTDTYFERGQGGKNFIVSALTKDSEDDVLKFYRDEFTKRGWTVKDGTPSSSASRFALSIDFTDGSKGEISGSVRADQADQDPQYTQVDLVLQVSGRRARGN